MAHATGKLGQGPLGVERASAVSWKLGRYRVLPAGHSDVLSDDRQRQGQRVGDAYASEDSRRES